MNREHALLAYVTRLGDNALILSQRMVELVAALPELEEELASANFALDYIGQARMFYTYAGELEGKGRSECDSGEFVPHWVNSLRGTGPCRGGPGWRSIPAHPVRRPHSR